MTQTSSAIQWITDLAYATGVFSFDTTYSLQTVIVVAIFQAILILKLYRDVVCLQDKLRAERENDATKDANNLDALLSKALTGSLDRFSICEVIQFLNSIRETGILDIVDEEVSAVHRLMVLDGEIIDAFNGDERGEAALRTILGCKEGSFTFIRGDLPSNESTINESTISLLMEAFKEMDELHSLQPA